MSASGPVRRARRLAAHALFWPTIFWNLAFHRLLRGRQWWDRIDERVWLGALPLARHAARLGALGVRAVVNMCEEYAGPAAAYARLGIEQLHVPTIDFTPPSLGDVRRAVAFMRDHIARGGGVYVHCKAGRARSATVVLCWLVAEKGLAPEAANALLVERRPQVLRHLHRREVVRSFVEALGEGEPRFSA